MQHGPLRKCHYDQGPRWKLGTWLWLCLSYNLIYFCLVFVRNSARSRGMLRQCPCPYAYTGPWTGRSHWTSSSETKPKRALEIRSWLQANFLQGAHNVIFHENIDGILVQILMIFPVGASAFFFRRRLLDVCVKIRSCPQVQQSCSLLAVTSHSKSAASNGWG